MLAWLLILYNQTQRTQTISTAWLCQFVLNRLTMFIELLPSLSCVGCPCLPIAYWYGQIFVKSGEVATSATNQFWHYHYQQIYDLIITPYTTMAERGGVLRITWPPLPCFRVTPLLTRHLFTASANFVCDVDSSTLVCGSRPYAH